MKIALNKTIILILFVMGGISESLAQNQNFAQTMREQYYNDTYIKSLDISENSWKGVISITQEELIKLNQNNVDTRAIELVIQNSIDAIYSKDLNKAYQLILEAREMTLKARENIMKASLSDTINKVNLEINNATSIGADTKPAAAKLEEAKRALSQGDYNNVSLFASDAYRLALSSNMGFVSIKDLISSKINVPKSKYDGHTVETTGLIRNIKTSGASYNFVIDDGNGVISVYYSGGLGDIKEGDSVSVKGVYNSQNINAASVSKGSGLVGGIGSNVKAPGFEAILAISIIGALWLRRK